MLTLLTACVDTLMQRTDHANSALGYSRQKNADCLYICIDLQSKAQAAESIAYIPQMLVLTATNLDVASCLKQNSAS